MQYLPSARPSPAVVAWLDQGTFHDQPEFVCYDSLFQLIWGLFIALSFLSHSTFRFPLSTIWAFPNDCSYLFTIIINLPSPDGSNTSSIFVALTPSASWLDQKFSDVVYKIFRGTWTPEIKRIATLRKILDIDITLYPNRRMNRVWGCINVGIIMKIGCISLPSFPFPGCGGIGPSLQRLQRTDNSLTPWSTAILLCGADSAGSHGKHLPGREGKLW